MRRAERALLGAAARQSQRRVALGSLSTCPRRAVVRSDTAGKVTPTTRRLHIHTTATGTGIPGLEHGVLGRDLVERTAPAANLPDAPPRVAVLGAGLTGLTSAYYLAQGLPEGSQVVVYEADGRVGGWVRSDKVPVETLEGGEVRVLLERGPRMASMAEVGGRLDRMVMYDLLLNHALIPDHGVAQSQRWIYHDKRLMPVPPFSSLTQMFENKLLWEVMPGALLGYLRRVILGWGGPLPSADMSVAAWVRDVFGSRRLGDTMASAALHGIWGGDVHQLSALSAIGPMFHAVRAQAPPQALLRIPAREYRFMNNFASRRPEVLRMWQELDGATMMLGPHGLESLPRALHDSLNDDPGVDVRLSTPVASLVHDQANSKVKVTESSGRTESYDKVISALPAHKLAALTRDELPTLSELHSVNIMTVNIWYPERDIVPDGLGYLIPGTTPGDENPERALGVFFDSRVGVGRSRAATPDAVDEPLNDADIDNTAYASEPGTKVFVLMGGHYYDKPGARIPSEAEAIDQAKALLERHIGVPRDTPCHAVARLADRCLPQHTVGHSERMTRLSGELDVSFGGRLAAVGGSYTKPGVAAALRAGWDVADSVASLDFLSNGLEDALEEVVLRPPTIDVPRHGIFGSSGMRKR